ncbi:MAG: DDE transposase, partial [Methylacidiphilales bacterium]|nr:DDE transposase [Candidatus Methylacidiphilales bacterium]
GYHARAVLKDLDGGPWTTRIAEPRPSNGYLRWHGDDDARAVVNAEPALLAVAIVPETA